MFYQSALAISMLYGQTDEEGRPCEEEEDTIQILSNLDKPSLIGQRSMFSQRLVPAKCSETHRVTVCPRGH